MTAEAAASLLGTTPTILALWEQRFGYPVPAQTENEEHRYPEEAMIALRDAINCQHSIPAAIRQAQRMPYRSMP